MADIAVRAVLTPILQPLVARCVAACFQPLRDCQGRLPDRPQPYRCAVSNVTAYVAVALLWSAVFCQAASFAPSHLLVSYTVDGSTAADAGVQVEGAQLQVRMSMFSCIVSNGTTEWKASAAQKVVLTTSESLLRAGCVFLIFAVTLVLCHLLMTARMLVELWRGAVFPCEEPGAMAFCGVMQLTFAGLPALLITIWLSRVQAAYADAAVGSATQLVQAGWWLQLTAWLLLQASCCCAHGGKSGLLQHGRYGGLSAQYQPEEEEDDNNSGHAGSSAVSMEQQAYTLDDDTEQNLQSLAL